MKSFYLQSDIDEICERLKDYKDYFVDKNVLVAGSNGFLGKYFQAVLSKLKANVFILDQSEPLLKLSNVRYHKGDVCDCNSFEFNYSGVKDGFDYVLAAASIASPKVYKQYPIQTLDVGFNGLKNCLDIAFCKDAKLLYFSSSEVYQSAEIVPTPETYVGAIPSDGERSCYDLSKIVGECLVYNYVKQYGVNATIVLPFNFYGPQIPDGRVMPSFMEKIVNNIPLEVYVGGEHTRCYTYINDGIVGCILALIKGKSGEKYNIGNLNDEISVLDLAKKTASRTDKNAEIKSVEYPEEYAGGSNPTRRKPDITKAKEELNFVPQISLDEGIDRFYSWAKENYKKE